LLRVRFQPLAETGDAELVALHLSGSPRPFVFYERNEFVRAAWVLGARTDLAITLAAGTVRIEDTSPEAIVRRCERTVALALLEDDPTVRENTLARAATMLERAGGEEQIADDLAPLAAYLAARREDDDFPF
jgi:hypothetical protein